MNNVNVLTLTYIIISLVRFTHAFAPSINHKCCHDRTKGAHEGYQSSALSFHHKRWMRVACNARVIKRKNNHVTMSAKKPSTNEEDDGISADDEWDEGGYEFMQDLQEAKQKLGSPIGYETTQEAEEAAENAQNAFLAAMKQVKQEFQESKNELGLDKAIDIVKSQWDMEDKLMDMEDADFDESGEFE